MKKLFLFLMLSVLTSNGAHGYQIDPRNSGVKTIEDIRKIELSLKDRGFSFVDESADFDDEHSSRISVSKPYLLKEEVMSLLIEYVEGVFAFLDQSSKGKDATHNILFDRAVSAQRILDKLDDSIIASGRQKSDEQFRADLNELQRQEKLMSDMGVRLYMKRVDGVRADQIVLGLFIDGKYFRETIKKNEMKADFVAIRDVITNYVSEAEDFLQRHSGRLANEKGLGAKVHVYKTLLVVPQQIFEMQFRQEDDVKPADKKGAQNLTGGSNEKSLIVSIVD